MATPVHRTSLVYALLLALVCFAGDIAAQQNNSRDFDSLALSAATARDSNHPPEAIQFYRRALDLRPDWAEGWWYLGTLLYDTDQFRDAIPAFQKVLALAPNAPGALNFLGLCEYEIGDYDSALRHLDQPAVRDAHEDPQLTRVTAFHLALLLNRSGNFARANQILVDNFSSGTTSDQLTFAFGLNSLHIPLAPPEIDPSKDALIQSAGRLALLVAQNQASQAVEAYPGLLQQYPNIPFLHSAYARALQSAGRSDEAAAQTQLESRLHPANTVTPSAIVTIYSNNAPRSGLFVAPLTEDSWQFAAQLFAAGRFVESIAPLKVTVSAHPENGTAWAMLGLAEFETKDYDNALLHLQKGASLGLGGSPESVRTAKYRLGLLLIRNSRFDQAATMLVPEADKNTLAPQIQFALGLALLHKPVLPEAVPANETSLVQSAGEISVLLHNSKYDAAFPKLEALIQSHPAVPMLHYTYGLALASFSRYDEAEVQFAAESRINPRSELPYIQRAFVQLQAHRPADALVSAEQAVKIAPKSAEAHYVLGRSLLDSGKFEDALKELQSAAQINPTSPEIHFNLAKVNAKLNRPEEAQRERRRFAELNAQIEKQRSETGSQSYGAAHTASDLSQSSTQP